MTNRFLLFILISLLSVQINFGQSTVIHDTTITKDDGTILQHETIVNNNRDTVIRTSDITQETNTNLDMQTDSNQEESEASPSFHQVLKTKFIEGGAGFMGIVLLTLILGLALCIERILYLHAA